MLGPPLGAPLLHHTWPSPPDSVVLCQKHMSLVHGATEGSRLLPWWLRGTSMCHHPHGHRSLLRLQWRDLLLVRREATAEFPFPWLGRPWWCHTAVLGQPQHRGCSGTRCSAQKGNLQPSPVRARARGFSAGFLSLPLPLILSSRFLEMKQTQAPAFCVALVGVTALLLHSPAAAVGIFVSGWLHLTWLLPLLPTPRDGIGQWGPLWCCVLHPSNGQQLQAARELSVHLFLLCND